MISGLKIKKLAEKAINSEGGDFSVFENQFRSMCGITKDEFGRTKYDPNKKSIDATEFNFTEMAESICGYNWSEAIDSYKDAQISGNVKETSGGIVTPSHLMNVNLFTAAIGSLIDAKVLETYNLPKFIGDDFVQVHQTRMNGGKHIGASVDGSMLRQAELAEAEEYPSVGLVEDYVSIPRNRRRGITISVNKNTLLYDLTGIIVSSAERAGEVVRYNREVRTARAIMGLDNIHNRLSQGPNATYQDTVGNIPYNYINEMAQELTDYRSVDVVMRLLARHVNPATNMEIDINLQDAILLVAPSGVLNARRVVSATEIAYGDLTAADLTLSRSPNPLQAAPRVASSMIWYNELVRELDDEDAAQGLWWFGSFKKGFAVAEAAPFESISAPLSSNDLRKDVILTRITRELVSDPYPIEPRYVARLGSESDLEAISGSEASPSPV